MSQEGHLVECKPILECLKGYLSLEQFSIITCCTRKMYHMFNTGTLKCIRSAYKKYHHPMKSRTTQEWVCYCIKLNCGEALQWLLEYTLRAFLKSKKRQTPRSNKYAVALSDFARCGYKESLKHNNVAMYKQCRELELKQAGVQARFTVTKKGHGKTVIQLVMEDTELSLESNDDLCTYMFKASALAGDVSSFTFWKEHCHSLHFNWSIVMFREILEYGTSPDCLDLVIESMKYPKEDATMYDMYHYALQNKHSQMLEYVISIDTNVFAQSATLQKDYLQKEDALNRLCFDLLRDPHDKKTLRALCHVQKRLELLRRTLLYHCKFDLEDYRRREHDHVNPSWYRKNLKKQRI